MMKSVRILGAALALSSFFAVPAVAQQAGYVPAYQTSRFTQPAVLQDTSYQQYGVQQTNGYALTARRINDDGPQSVVPSPAPGAESVVPGPVVAAPEQVQAGPAFGGGSSCGCNGGNGGAPTLHDAAMYGSCGGGDCMSLPSACSWTGYFGGLYMNRTRANKTWTTYETGNNPNQLMYYPDSDWAGGAEVRVGKYIGCGCDTMIEGVYYGLYNMNGSDSRYSPTNHLSSPLDFGFVQYGAAGQPGAVFFDNAREHRVSRSDEFHNVEVNFIRYLCGCGQTNACQPLSIGLINGFRFMRFDDSISFASSSSGNDFGTNPLQEAYLNTDVTNTLYGYQIGALINHQVSCNWSWFARPTVGIFGNHMETSVNGYRGDGFQAQVVVPGYANQNLSLKNDKDDIAVMGQLDLGLNYKAGCHWSLTAGYRVIGITGVALADDQVPTYVAAANDWTDIDSHGSLILHGVFAGATYAW